MASSSHLLTRYPRRSTPDPNVCEFHCQSARSDNIAWILVGPVELHLGITPQLVELGKIQKAENLESTTVPAVPKCESCGRPAISSHKKLSGVYRGIGRGTSIETTSLREFLVLV